jgi:hypothetical protein
VRVLVACEFSGIVRDAFIARGHDAVSCDLLPTERPGPHIIGDVRELLIPGMFDLMIAHPPCTYLAVSGMHWNKRIPGREAKTEEALEFVRALLDAPIPRIALENPISVISTRIRKPDQIVQPYWFGHPESKQTALWLKGLPVLVPTNMLHRPAWVRCETCDDFICTIHKGQHVADCPCPGIEVWAKRGIDPYTDGGRWDNQTPSGQNKLGPSPDRWKDRSRTYEGFAEAMAEQWGRL